MALLSYQELLQPFPIAVRFWLGLCGHTRLQNLGKVDWKGPLSLISPSILLGVGLLVSIDHVSCDFVLMQLGGSSVFFDYFFQC